MLIQVKKKSSKTDFTFMVDSSFSKRVVAIASASKSIFARTTLNSLDFMTSEV